MIPVAVEKKSSRLYTPLSPPLPRFLVFHHQLHFPRPILRFMLPLLLLMLPRPLRRQVPAAPHPQFQKAFPIPGLRLGKVMPMSIRTLS